MADVENPDVPSSEEEEVEPVQSKKLKKKRKLKLADFKLKKKLRARYEDIYKSEMLGALKEDVDENEKQLERLVFGGEEDVLEQLERRQDSDKPNKEDSDQDDSSHFDEVDENDKKKDATKEDESRIPAWNDEDDEKILVSDKVQGLKNCHRSLLKRSDQKYEMIAREKFLKITGEPSWADLKNKKKKSSTDSDDSDENEEDELMQKTGNFILKGQSLPKGKIDLRKCQNLTELDTNRDVIRSVEFHPMSRVAVVAGNSGSATLYQVDGKTNPKIQSVHFQRFPIYTAHFSTDGNELLVGSREFGHYFTYDMISGKISKVPWEVGMGQANVKRFAMSPDGKLMIIHGRYGKIQIISAKSKEWIQSLKMNGEVIASAFSKDGSKLYTHGEGGQVYVWDMNSRLCIHKFTDEGCITGTSLALSQNEQYLAAGSDSGVVNIYDASSVMVNRAPKPLKAVMNLTTEISRLKFNNSSEILAMASGHKTESIKLMHFPSMTVFSNFPIQERKLRYINALDFSPNSGYLMLGNNIGKVYLYRLRHFANY